jgi:hypothetical protein
MEFKAKNEGRIQNSRFLLIEPSILRAQGALISKDVSNKADAKYGNPNEFIEQIDLQVIYNRTDWKDKAVQERLKTARKYEILIPHHVATGLIRNL